MATAKVYHNGILLGQGTVAAGASAITAYTANDNGGLTHDVARRCGHNRVVHVVTSGFVTSNGVYKSRVTKDRTILAASDLDFSNALSMARACPYL